MAIDTIEHKLLDAWSQPRGVGVPIGCIVTSFSFDGGFFEEECLCRFLNVQSDPHSDGPVYLVELEDKLASLEGISVLIDQHHAHGSRSLRWDLIPIRMANKGVMHAKISILCYADLIRLIIGSANLTEKAYRDNLEIFGIVDCSFSNNDSVELIRVIVDYISDLTRSSVSQDSPDRYRLAKLVGRIRSMLGNWDQNVTIPKNKIPSELLLISPESESLFDQVRKLWNQYGSGTLRRAFVASPFYTSIHDLENKPSHELWNVLAQKGKAEVNYLVPINEHSQEDIWYLRAPKSLESNAPLHRQEVQVKFRPVQERIREGKEETIRPFHLKFIWFESDYSIMLIMGSSNFTSAGTGLGKAQNFEANFCYCFSKKKHAKSIQLAKQILSIAERPMKNYEFLKEDITNEDEIGTDEILPLHPFFNTVIYTRENQYMLVMNFEGSPPKEFKIFDEQERLIYCTIEWESDGKPKSKSIFWEGKPLVSGLWVIWDDIKGKAYWPVIISDPKLLPPPEELRDLSLDVLIQVITTSRPLHMIIKRHLRQKERNKDKKITDYLDPHQRVDTTKFLLQRTRKISFALNALKERLERPVYTIESLNWRLNGPVGVMALTRAILLEAESDEERVFLVAEIALELSQLNYRESQNTISLNEIKSNINEVLRELFQEIKPYRKKIMPEMRSYVKKAFKVSNV